MRIEDLRNFFTNCNDRLIEVSGDFIYYAEEKVEEGLNSLFLLEYNRMTKRERIIANYILNDPSFVCHYFSFSSDMIIIMENGGSDAWILRVDKASGQERNFVQLCLIEDVRGYIALDAGHILFFTAAGTKGEGHAAYLYDLEEQCYYYIHDPRICALDAHCFVPFDPDGQVRLLVLQPYGDEADKEKAYRDRRWLGDHVNDNVWICPLLDFIVSVKAGEAQTPLELIMRAGTAGLLRYVGMDGGSLYFRAKYYPDNDQRICAYNKLTGKKTVVAPLNASESGAPSSFLISAGEAPLCAYRVTKGDDYSQVDGVIHSSLHTYVKAEVGDIVACVEDRYLVGRYILADEENSYEFHTIFDSKTGRQQSFECRAAVKGDTVVLY